MRLLSIDFDYFFPVPGMSVKMDAQQWALYDWGHQETTLHISPLLWGIRAAGFKRAGLPLPQLAQDPVPFWKRFRLTEKAEIYVAESHLRALSHLPEREDITEIWNFDAHHDAGYGDLEDLRNGLARCDNWIAHYAAYGLVLGSRIHQRYPKWRHQWVEEEPRTDVAIDRATDSGKSLQRKFDVVFVCRSGAWFPAWLDDEWDRFIAAAPKKVTFLEPTRNRKEETMQIAEQDRWSTWEANIDEKT